SAPFMSCESRAPTATGVTESSARADNADATMNADAIPVRRCIRAILPSACHPPPSGPVFGMHIDLETVKIIIQPSCVPTDISAWRKFALKKAAWKKLANPLAGTYLGRVTNSDRFRRAGSPRWVGEIWSKTVE